MNLQRILISALGLLGAVAAGTEVSYVKAQSPIIFIHGIKGSTLVSSTGQVQWLTPAEALGFSSADLKLPLTWNPDGSQSTDGLRAGEVLRQIRIIPRLYEQQIYGPFMQWGESLPPGTFSSYAYDWRRDNIENAQKFEAYVDKIRAEHAGARVRVVAHSMGGLITLAVLNRAPEKFESVVFAGVPFGGGIGFLKDMHAGASTGWNRGILAPEVLFTFPSTYTLYPTGSTGLVNTAHEPLPINFYAAADWYKYGLGVFAPGRKTVATAADRLYLESALARAQKFRALLTPPVGFGQPPVLVVSGSAKDTLVTAVQAGPKSVRGWDFDSAPKIAGDGRVSLPQSLPPPGISYAAFLSKKDHGDLLNDPAVIERIKAFYAEPTKR